nr:MAG: replication initiator protein [Microvirus sp.]
MLCKKPFHSFGCGQCLPCRVKRRRIWTHRILLEALCYEENSFLTLTYKNQPEGGTLVPRDFQLWLKRFREALSEDDRPTIRFFGVGEYGDKSGRPHYHAALFGAGRDVLPLVQKTWSKDGESLGHVMLGSLTLASAQYIAGYVTKKMTKPDDSRLNGRHPEFSRMSQGIGRGMVPQIAKSLKGVNYVCRSISDVPTVLSHGPRTLPLGRYLRAKLVPHLGLPDKNSHSLLERHRYDTLRNADAALDAYQKMQDLLSRHVDYPPGTPRWKVLRDIHSQIKAEESQRILQIEKKHLDNLINSTKEF